MGLTVAKITAQRVNVPLTFGEDTLNVTYKPAAYTPEFEKHLQQPGDDEAKCGVLAFMVNRLVDTWDLTGDDGGVFPLGETNLATLPVKFLSEVIKGIIDDFSPNTAKSAT